MHSRAPTTKFFVVLTDYLRDQVGSGFTVIEEDPDPANSYKKVLRIDTKQHRLNKAQRDHIEADAERLIPAMYSVKIEFKP